jgi:hypothetical protein
LRVQHYVVLHGDRGHRRRGQFRLLVIGILLNWLFLKEKVSLVCWSGIGLVFSGVALFGARLFFDRLMAKVWSLTINDARLFFLNWLNR